MGNTQGKMKNSTRRTEIQRLYNKYASDEKTLSISSLLMFLCNKQAEDQANMETAGSLIDRYEIDETAKENRSMTFEGFFRYMESKDCCIFNQEHTLVYQNMYKPLTDYFISSSHNTCLTEKQVFGRSELIAFQNALMKGCRCLEIDCWNGPNNEPIVTHGYTWTTSVTFKDVITTVERYAFEKSVYPVILSLDDHCSEEQQVVMAQHLISILGDKLLRAPLNRSATRDLPSPKDLQNKILISDTKSMLELQAGARPQRAKALSDLIIYTGSVEFDNFRNSADNQNCYENTSMSEEEARNLVNASGADFVQHNQRFLTRIYPAFWRIFSSNYDPQEFWNVGSQLVTLNFQTKGMPMDLNDGRFLDNGACGYVLKPEALLSRQGRFDPSCSMSNPKTTTLKLKVISGANLPKPENGNSLDPFVRVQIYGIPFDSCTQTTYTIQNNLLTPRWNVKLRFRISVPELCLIRFCVRGQTGPDESDFIGQYTLPFTSLKKGYRWVPLRSRDGGSLDRASLFVFVY